MGINFREIVVRKPISLEELRGRKLAVDAFNVIYQFVSAIRQHDGKPLTDKDGNTTSHLNGIFYRTLKLMQAGAKPCFVFDGDAPELKAETQAERSRIRLEAADKQRAALELGDFTTAKKYAQQTTRLTSDMILEAKELVSAMGLPWVQALGDAEAQAAYMAQVGQVWAVVSQDYDALLFGAPKVVRELTVSQKKRGGKIINPEILVLSDTLNALKLDRPKLVDAAVLIGTDYNEGVKGIGPKTAVKIVQEERFSEYEKQVPRLKAVRSIFLKPAITTSYSLEWKPMDVQRVKEILCGRHGFNEERIDKALGLSKSQTDKNQKSLSDF